jgi:hypothetical protein
VKKPERWGMMFRISVSASSLRVMDITQNPI